MVEPISTNNKKNLIDLYSFKFSITCLFLAIFQMINLDRNKDFNLLNVENTKKHNYLKNWKNACHDFLPNVIEL